MQKALFAAADIAELVAEIDIDDYVATFNAIENVRWDDDSKRAFCNEFVAYAMDALCMLSGTAERAYLLSLGLSCCDEAVLANYGLDRAELAQVGERYRRCGIWHDGKVTPFKNAMEAIMIGMVGRNLLTCGSQRQDGEIVFRPVQGLAVA